MELFEVSNSIAKPSVHALIIEPWKSLWEKDTSKDKAEAIKVFTYIELLCSPKKSNPFHGYPDDLRPKKVRKNVWGDENYIPDLYSIPDIIRAVDAYKEQLEIASPGYDLYLSARNASDTLRDYLNNFNLDERTNGGAMVIKPADVTKAINDIPEVIKNLDEARMKMLADLKEAAKTRSNREIGPFER